MVDTALIIEGIKLIKTIYDQVETMKDVALFTDELKKRINTIQSILAYDGFNNLLKTGRYEQLDKVLNELVIILTTDLFDYILPLQGNDIKTKALKFFKAKGNKEKYQHLIEKISGAIQDMSLMVEIESLIQTDGFVEWVKAFSQETSERLLELEKTKVPGSIVSDINIGKAEKLKEYKGEVAAFDVPKENISEALDIIKLALEKGSIIHRLDAQGSENLEKLEQRTVAVRESSSSFGPSNSVSESEVANRVGFFPSPEIARKDSGFSNRVFIKEAERILSEVKNSAYKDDEDIKDSMDELSTLKIAFRENMKSATKEQRDEIRGKIAEIEYLKETIDRSQKKTSPR